ncbi:3-hydroxyacyl-CoA dehydrogenase/enoyl-CoA hydratase family protein [Zoogloea sp.]|uniref:3-hydroxyacyl-CoA dehydrogenase/enoyl-CoA hydratase family protein n=1 Tax=Zoogloea sp. TaxID=49181 RepID=UPI0035ADDD06
MSRLKLGRVAVLGAGVMGAQIAAHVANAGVPVLLFDLAAPGGDPRGVARKAVEGLRKQTPAPLALAERASLIEPLCYDLDLARLTGCDLVIEAIAERLDWKEALYARILPHLGEDAILASNTSGLSVARLAGCLPAARQARFCGLHFFNPPRYMSLVELIPAPATDPALLDGLETWLTSALGKGVVRALDTPNFIANRIGVFSMLAVMHHTQAFGLALDEVDALTGPAMGRPKSATYRTADVVGLDTLAHVVKTLQDTLPDDPWHAYFRTPAWLDGLLAQGALGQKTPGQGGIFRKEGKQILVLDPASGTHRPAAGSVAPEVAEMLAEADPARRFARLRASAHPQARFVWAVYRDLFHYCAVQLEHIAANARDLDLALRWGFGWAQGPFETWQAAGWQALAEAVRADIEAGLSLAPTPLPAWVFDGRSGVHGPEGAWSAAARCAQPRSRLPVYGRQLYPETLQGEAAADPGVTLWENAELRLWHLPARDARIGIVSFNSKMHTIGTAVLEGMQEALARAERDLDGLVIWHAAPFAVGANLLQLLQACQAGAFEQVEQVVANFQRTTQAIKYARVPVVAAVQGMAFGGGCEFAMHAHHRVLALESYVGLVEAGVGLIPAGGGCKELVLRAADLASRAAGGDVFPFVQNFVQTVSMGKASRSALEAVNLGFAQATDDILFNPHELLHAALHRARAMAEAGHRPPVPRGAVPVAGRSGIATCELGIVNMLEGGFISEWDAQVGRSVAVALCGGEVETGARVPEAWLLDVERAQFMHLVHNAKTQARIAHMLETGKPLRN